jgi:hypothetical protein
MKYFDFSTQVTDKVVSEIKVAREYIRIAVFQLHNPAVFDALQEKLAKRVKVEILTLPYDSINPDVKDRVTKAFESLKNNGAKINFCKWNIGDPANTKTAVARWYSFHGKFIVTDKSAITLSANFTDNAELDAIFVSDDEKLRKNYNAQFERLIEYFVKPYGQYEGMIHNMIEKTAKPEQIKEIFSLPENVAESHKNNWVRDYPKALCPDGYTEKDGLFITPFDFQGRSFIEKLVNEAAEFVYVATESFTDPDFPSFLISVAQKGIKIRVLAGVQSRDFTDRLQNSIREMLAAGIKVKAFDGDIHAKMIVTDKAMMLGSINLNMINLGFSKKSDYWRENTETFSQCNDRKIIENAKRKYEVVFDSKSVAVESKLVEKLEKELGQKLNVIFSIRLEKDARRLLAVAVLNRECEVKSFILEIGKAMKKLIEIFERKKADKEIFYMALILYGLSERKRVYDEIKSALVANEEVQTKELLVKLLEKKLIAKDGEFYKRSVV